MSLKILLVDDHKIMRDGLKLLLEAQLNMVVVGEAENGKDAVKMAEKVSPDVILMDISMPGLNGIDAAKQIFLVNPDVKIVALSMYSDKRYVAGMLKAGVSGYLLKDSAFEEIAHALDVIMKGKTYTSPEITSIVLKDYAQHLNENQASTVSLLTLREREVLQLVAEGLSTKNIASSINVSIKTVETHRRQIMKKLNLFSIAELTKFAIREGLTSL